MHTRILLTATTLLCIAAAMMAGPVGAMDAYPLYKGIACNIDGSYQCGGSCPKDRCWCCEKPAKTCSG